MVLSLVLGDGCLHYFKRGAKLYGGLTIDHGLDQADYQSWKAKLLSDILDREVKVRTGHKGKSVQLNVCMKRFRSWRKFTYPNDRKSIPLLLKFINNPEFAATVWLLDDGYVESSISKLSTGEKKNYGARFRLFINSQNPEEAAFIVQWFEKQLNVQPKIKFTRKTEPFLKFTQEDSLKLWSFMRTFVLQFKSMRYKFRYIESIYQYKLAQRITNLG